MTVITTNLQNRIKFAVAFGAAIIASCVSVNAVFAASSNQTADPSQTTAPAQDGVAFDPAKLAAAEKLYFGHSFEQMPVEQRMDKLERGVFGHNRSGSLGKRFERVNAALGTQNFANPAATSVADGPARSEEKSESKPEIAQVKPEEKTGTIADNADSKKTQVQELSANDVRVQGLLKAGMNAHRNGQIQAAEGQFKAALVVDPRCADAFYNLGSIAESKGDLLSALTNYRAALGINPLDKELQDAVKAVEDDMSRGRAITGSAGAAGAAANNAMPKAAPPYSNYASSSADNKLFNLQTAQSNALMQAQGNNSFGNVSQPPIPVYNVSQQPAPVLGANQPKSPSHNNAATNAMVNVLMQASGLHCPICRLRSLGNW